jgi:hypothetical protein
MLNMLYIGDPERIPDDKAWRITFNHNVNNILIRYYNQINHVSINSGQPLGKTLYKKGEADKIGIKEVPKVLKKIQVMLPMWLSDHIERMSEIVDLSVSEFMRLQLCLAVIAYTSIAFPQYKPDLTLKKICSDSRKLLSSDDRESYLRFLSKIYFEARKAVEFRIKNKKFL